MARHVSPLDLKVNCARRIWSEIASCLTSPSAMGVLVIVSLPFFVVPTAAKADRCFVEVNSNPSVADTLIVRVENRCERIRGKQNDTVALIREMSHTIEDFLTYMNRSEGMCITPKTLNERWESWNRLGFPREISRGDARVKDSIMRSFRNVFTQVHKQMYLKLEIYPLAIDTTLQRRACRMNIEHGDSIYTLIRNENGDGLDWSGKAGVVYLSRRCCDSNPIFITTPDSDPIDRKLGRVMLDLRDYEELHCGILRKTDYGAQKTAILCEDVSGSAKNPIHCRNRTEVIEACKKLWDVPDCVEFAESANWSSAPEPEKPSLRGDITRFDRLFKMLKGDITRFEMLFKTQGGEEPSHSRDSAPRDIVLITDGMHSESTKDSSDITIEQRKAVIKELWDMLRKYYEHRIPIRICIVKINEAVKEHSQRDLLLRDIVQMTGGCILKAKPDEKNEELLKNYFKAQYEIEMGLEWFNLDPSSPVTIVHDTQGFIAKLSVMPLVGRVTCMVTNDMGERSIRLDTNSIPSGFSDTILLSEGSRHEIDIPLGTAGREKTQFHFVGYVGNSRYDAKLLFEPERLPFISPVEVSEDDTIHLKSNAVSRSASKVSGFVGGAVECEVDGVLKDAERIVSSLQVLDQKHLAWNPSLRSSTGRSRLSCEPVAIKGLVIHEPMHPRERVVEYPIGIVSQGRFLHPGKWILIALLVAGIVVLVCLISELPWFIRHVTTFNCLRIGQLLALTLVVALSMLLFPIEPWLWLYAEIALVLGICLMFHGRIALRGENRRRLLYFIVVAFWGLVAVALPAMILFGWGPSRVEWLLSKAMSIAIAMLLVLVGSELMPGSNPEAGEPKQENEHP